MSKKMKIYIIVAAVALAVVSIGAVEYTSQTGFCNSCHEMNEPFAGWETGVHQDVHCYGCHADEGLINTVKVKANGLQEVYIHLTEEVNMDEVEADVPVDRCVKCHDFTKEGEYNERIADFHVKHKEYNYDCLSCHTPAGHTSVSFDGFKNDTCTTCHKS